MAEATDGIDGEKARALAHGEPRAGEVIGFWRDAGPARWFVKSDAFDALIHRRFEGRVREARGGDLDRWTATPDGLLGLILLLDQFPRNLYRDTPAMFASDDQAIALAKRAIEEGADKAFDKPMRKFVYMPFMHSEEMAEQERSLELFGAMNDADTMKFAEIHADAIRRFGRFPHRNAILGRETTAEEAAYLEEGGFKG